MYAGFPIAISRTMTTAAEGRAISDFQLTMITRLESDKIGLVVAIEAIVVATMRAVPHDDVLVFIWDEEFAVCIVTQWWWLVLFMTAVAIEI